MTDETKAQGVDQTERQEPEPKKNRSMMIAILAAVAVAGWIGSGYLDQDAGGESDLAEGLSAEPAEGSEAEPLIPVRVATFKAEARPSELLVFGRTEADRHVTLRAETAGAVADVLVEKGDLVEADQVIARLNLDDREARLREAKAELNQARIQYRAAQKLQKKQFQSEVRLAESAAEYEAAKAELAMRELDMRRTEIKAPFAGIVNELPVDVGDVLAVGDPVGAVVDLDPIKIAADVAEREIDGLDVGGLAHAVLVSGRALEGRIQFISRAANAQTRTFLVEIDVPNPDLSIAEGLTAEVRLPLGRALAHLVSPSTLTLADDGQLGVKGLDATDHVVFYPVQILDDTTQGVWLAGLPETVRLITVGHEYVIAGQQVAAKNDDGRGSALAGDAGEGRVQ
ncbi:MAG: efflux RND transporter periplasmic adaptor subunit [Magnetovibrionaceae bacterium]